MRASWRCTVAPLAGMLASDVNDVFLVDMSFLKEDNIKLPWLWRLLKEANHNMTTLRLQLFSSQTERTPLTFFVARPHLMYVMPGIALDA